MIIWQITSQEFLEFKLNDESFSLFIQISFIKTLKQPHFWNICMFVALQDSGVCVCTLSDTAEFWISSKLCDS